MIKNSTNQKKVNIDYAKSMIYYNNNSNNIIEIRVTKEYIINFIAFDTLYF